MSKFDENRMANRRLAEEGRFTPNWVTDLWNLPSGELKPKYDWKEYPKRTTPIWCSLLDCILETEDSFKCCDCQKREYGIPWLPEQYNNWTEQEKIEWKLRIKGGSNGNIGAKGNLPDNQSSTEKKK